MLKSRMLGNPLVRFPEGRGWQPHAGVPRLLDPRVTRGASLCRRSAALCDFRKTCCVCFWRGLVIDSRYSKGQYWREETSSDFEILGPKNRFLRRTDMGADLCSDSTTSNGG
jgi:hypothetical protein